MQCDKNGKNDKLRIEEKEHKREQTEEDVPNSQQLT